jgi:hypothetical protein
MVRNRHSPHSPSGANGEEASMASNENGSSQDGDLDAYEADYPELFDT